jgi:acetoin utilization deacetylase AcuC-like enzyme
MESVISGECRATFALVRPPGHHALKDRAGGFCIFNNLGIVARRAIERHGFERILIIDWDIHHGNAIQDLFYNDNRVFYLSSHYMGWYPHTGDWQEAGEGPGTGYTVNIIVPKTLRDDDIVHIYSEVLGPVFRSYRPELVMVAAGFDAHERDPLGRTKLTEKAYRWMTQLVLQWCDATKSAPLMLSLEGGYDNRALAASVREVLGVLAHDGRRERVPVVKTDTGRAVLQKVFEIHRKHKVWIG